MLERRILVVGLVVAACEFGSNAGSATAGVGNSSTGAVDGGPVATTNADGVATAGSITNASQGTGTGTPTTSTTDGPGSGDASTDGPTDSTGGAPQVLVDRHLIARYYLDEDTTGSVQPDAFDAAPDPINLTLDYTGGQPAYVNPARSQTGLAFGKVSQTGYAGFGNVDGTKFEEPLETTAATIEVVVELGQVSDTPGEPSQLVWLGGNGNTGKIALAAGLAGFRMSFSDGLRSAWNVPMNPRQVVTLVLDTTERAAQNRARLYIDGVLTPSTSGDPPSLNAEISVPNNAWFMLGNTTDEAHSFAGILYYAAIYNGALTADEVADNAAVLAVDDDTPR